MLFDVASIALGGSYWNHYLVQLVVPVAVLSGLLVASRQPAARTVLVAVALAAVTAVGVYVTGSHTTAGTSVGEAVGDVAAPQDTIVTTWGHADVTRASGLSSPYPYLWSLPARTLDPNLVDLRALLAGPRAPTWFVRGAASAPGTSTATAPSPPGCWPRTTTRWPRSSGHTIYLHRGVERAVPDLSPPSADLSASSARTPDHPPTKDLP